MQTTQVKENNAAKVLGFIETMPQISHYFREEKFYAFVLRCPRLSEADDYINVMMNHRVYEGVQFEMNQPLRIEGQFRSHNNYSGQGNKLQLVLYAKTIDNIDQIGEGENTNEIQINGFVCKAPVYRVTPFGREICDLLIAVNRAFNKSDYIPCITWGKNAKNTSALSVGDNIKITGRIQSRDYKKKVDEEQFVTKTAYEISVSKFEIV